MRFEDLLLQNNGSASLVLIAPKTGHPVKLDAGAASLLCPLQGLDHGGLASAEPFPAEGLASPKDLFVRVPPMYAVPHRDAAAGESAAGRESHPRRARR